MRVGVLDPEKEVAVCLGCQIDQVVDGGGVAIASTVRARGFLQTRRAASHHGVQHLPNELLQEQVTHTHDKMERV